MPSIKSLAVAAVTGLLPLVSASPMISRLQTPTEVHAGDNVTATLSTSIYIQNWEDFSIIWGLAPTQYGGQDAQSSQIYVGQQIGYTQLYGTDTAKLTNFTVQVQIPESQPAGEWLLVGAVPYLVGASGSTSLRSFNTTIKVIE
ncbi:hypothetical protein F4808DRAFT_456156 [Astrocystis sublimbata]|nr:hypothetical protein F4808DRAFT_456156 [Astrocystis sublimbata]